MCTFTLHRSDHSALCTLVCCCRKFGNQSVPGSSDGRRSNDAVRSARCQSSFCNARVFQSDVTIRHFNHISIWLGGPVGVSGTHSPPCGLFVAMRVIVISASTGGLVWDCTSGSFRQARGWELRMWLCDAINCTLYFSVVLFTREMLLCDMAYINEYAEGNLLTVYMLRREIDNPSDYDTRQVETALRFSDRLGLWAVASR